MVLTWKGFTYFYSDCLVDMPEAHDYNFCKIHSSLSVTPAMQADLTKRVMSVEDIVNLAAIQPPKKRGSYKKGHFKPPLILPTKCMLISQYGV